MLARALQESEQEVWYVL